MAARLSFKRLVAIASYTASTSLIILLLCVAALSARHLNRIHGHLRADSDFAKLAHSPGKSIILIDPRPVPSIRPLDFQQRVHQALQTKPLSVIAGDLADLPEHYSVPDHGSMSETYHLTSTGGFKEVQFALQTFRGDKYSLTSRSPAEWQSVPQAEGALLGLVDLDLENLRSSDEAKYRYNVILLSTCVLLALMLTSLLLLSSSAILYVASILLGEERERYREQWSSYLLDTPSVWGRFRIRLGIFKAAIPMTVIIRVPRRAR